MKTQYTPGKWTVGYDDGSGQKVIREDKPGIEGKNIAVIRWGCSCCENTAPLTDEEQANARLIAAAPLIYEALKELGDWDLHSKCADGTPAKNAEASLANARRFARAAVVAAEGN